MITITNNFHKDSQLAREAGLIGRNVSKAKLYSLIDEHNAKENVDRGLPANAAHYDGNQSWEDIEADVNDGKAVSIMDMIDAQKNDRKAEQEAIATEDSPEVIEAAREQLNKLYASDEEAAEMPSLEELDAVVEGMEEEKAKKKAKKKAPKTPKEIVEVVWAEKTDSPRPIRPETKVGKLLTVLQEGKDLSLDDWKDYGYPSRSHMYRKVSHIKTMGYGLTKKGSIFRLIP